MLQTRPNITTLLTLALSLLLLHSINADFDGLVQKPNTLKINGDLEGMQSIQAAQLVTDELETLQLRSLEGTLQTEELIAISLTADEVFTNELLGFSVNG